MYDTLAIGTQVAVTVLDDGSVDQDALDRLMLIVSGMLAELSQDPSRASLIKKIRLCEYSWFTQNEFELLKTIVKHCQHHLEHFQIARQHPTTTSFITDQDAFCYLTQSLNSETTELGYAQHIQPFWDYLVRNTPALRLLSLRGGPNADLNLTNCHLTQLDVMGYRFDSDTDGPLPLTLTAIKFVYVTGITASLFRPELFDSLQVLLVRAVDDLDVIQLTRIIQSFTATGRQSTLKSFSISINQHPPELEWMSSPLTLNTLLAAFTPHLFPQLTTIEILSTHTDGSMLTRALTLCRNLPTCFPQVRDLTVLLGVHGSGLLSLKYAPKSVADFAECFAGMRDLDYLTMNIIDNLEPNDNEAKQFFRYTNHEV
ncbi:hypothetical protein OIV83_005724 [Microbotryomycetes sp. JL201]|nr:hypothetical protein OIV83_005724 [Microbotryomycetes sp. JL201]